MLLRKIKDDPQTRLYVSTCKYCGSTYIKFQNASKYCSDTCRYYSDLEHTEKRVRKYREKNQGSINSKWIGTGYLGSHASKDCEKEILLISREKKKIKSQNMKGVLGWFLINLKK